MIVQCVGCKARLRVDELKIPAEGGLKMRCPKCKALFRVRKPGAVGGAAHVCNEADVSPSSTAGQVTALFGGGTPDDALPAKRSETAIFGDSAKTREATNIWGGEHQPTSQRGTAIFGASDLAEASENFLSSGTAKDHGGTAIFGGVPELSGQVDALVATETLGSSSDHSATTSKTSVKTEIFGVSDARHEMGNAAESEPESPVSRESAESQNDDARPDEATKVGTSAPEDNKAARERAPIQQEAFCPSENASQSADSEDVDDNLLGDFPLDASAEAPEALSAVSDETVALVSEVPLATNSENASALVAFETRAAPKPERASEQLEVPTAPQTSLEMTEEVGGQMEGLLSSSNAQRERTILRKKRQARNKLVVFACIVVALAVVAAVVSLSPAVRAQAFSLWNQAQGALGLDRQTETFSLHKQRWGMAKTATGNSLMVLSAEVRNNASSPQKIRWVRITMMKDGTKVARSLGVTGVKLAEEDLLALRKETDLTRLLRKKISSAPKEILPGNFVPLTMVFFADQEAVSGATMTLDWDASGK